MASLTKRLVDAAKPQDKDYFLWDGDVAGFGLRVFPSGVKTYLVQYRMAGRTRRVKISYHGHLTVEEARKQAKILLGKVAKGDNPAEDRAGERAAITVEELCKRYLAAAEKGLILNRHKQPKKISTLYTDKGRINWHIVPLLGKRKVRDITSADVTRFMRDVQSGKTATDIKSGPGKRTIVEGGSGTAARTVGLLGGIFSFAVSEGLRLDNPVRGVQRPADNQKKIFLTQVQYRKLGMTLKRLEQEGENKKAINAIWLIALTGCRRGEVENLSWSEVDKNGHCFRLGDTKTGESIRPVGKAAFNILEKVTKNKKSDYVFARDDGEDKFVGLPKAWLRIIEEAGLLKTGITMHSLRHSFASVANELQFTPPTIAAMLGHSLAAIGITGRYIHHLDETLIHAANKISAKIYEYMTE